MKRFIERRTQTPIEGVLLDCVDGVIDADKLDYLIRDSVNCRVRYGQALDVPRFLRGLTVAVPPKQRGKGRAYLTVRAKSRASAEAFAFARYELYSALYWHHTYRALKAMVLDAGSRGPKLPKRKGDRGAQMKMEHLDVRFTQDLYYYFVIRSLPWGEAVIRAGGAKITKAEQAEAGVIPSALADERSLEFLWRVGTDGARALIERVGRRELHSRLFEWPVEHIPESGRMDLKELLGPSKRRDIIERVRLKLMDSLESRAQRLVQDDLTMKADRVLDRLSELRKDDTAVVLDCPLRGWLPGGVVPYQIPDYKRKYVAPTADVEDRSTVIWRSVLPELMRNIAMFRVYCCQELAGFAFQLLTSQQIRAIAEDSLPGLFPAE